MSMRQRRMIGTAVEDCLFTLPKAPSSPGLPRYRRSRPVAEVPPTGEPSREPERPETVRGLWAGNTEPGSGSPSWGRQKPRLQAMTRGMSHDFAKLNADMLDRALRA